LVDVAGCWLLILDGNLKTIIMLSNTAFYRNTVFNALRLTSKAKSIQKATPATASVAVPTMTTVRTFANDPTFGGSATPFYSPTLTHKRAGEMGRGGRSSEAGCKVAVFGGSGFLGGFVCAELGK
jgi:hypothetical protein